MRNYLDLGPYRRATVGFDQLFDSLEAQMRGSAGEADPPFDISRSDDDHYRIVLSVPGLSHEEIDITAQRNQLIVTGKPTTWEGGEYLHRGIHAAPFERHFQLSDFMEVGEATLKNGLLTIELQRVVPEALKPRKIAIRSEIQQHQHRLEAPQEAA